MPKSNYSPFNINLDKSQTSKKSEGFGVMDKLKTFFQSTEKDKVKGGSKEEVKGKTVNDQYQELKKKWLVGEKQQDKKVLEPVKEETAEDLNDPKKI